MSIKQTRDYGPGSICVVPNLDEGFTAGEVVYRDYVGDEETTVVKVSGCIRRFPYRSMIIVRGVRSEAYRLVGQQFSSFWHARRMFRDYRIDRVVRC